MTRGQVFSILSIGLILAVFFVTLEGTRTKEGTLQPSQILAAATRPHVSACIKVASLDRIDDINWSASLENVCDYTLPLFMVEVKFFDADWNRIGVSEFGGSTIAPNEKMKTKLDVPAYVRGYKHIGVRRITDGAK